MDGKNEYCYKVHTTKSHLSIQCNPYQDSTGIFFKEIEEAILNLCGTTKDPKKVNLNKLT